jgi:Zn-dependent peptidase ImmA (M78 family)/transcriptional regulator with XRE-family HTH domain
MVTEAYLSPNLLRWARERDHLSLEDAAHRTSVAADRFRAWEAGETHPTWRQAQGLAKTLRVPFGYLFLSKPPNERLPLPDLRTIGDGNPATPSIELRDVLKSAVAKQEWYREYQIAEGAPQLPFIGRFSGRRDYTKIAADIRNTIGMDGALRGKAAGPDDFLRTLIGKVEGIGVVVLRSGVVHNNTHRKLDLQEFRGFAISDEIAPLVFINGDDAKVAQVFTLLHELGHLWIGESAISDSDYRSPLPRNESERLCNQVAAEALVPGEELLAVWDKMATVNVNLQQVSKRFHVSRLVVLRKAVDADLVPRATFQLMFARLIEERHPKPTSKGGGDFYASVYVRNSRTLTGALLTALAEGRVLYTEAAQLLDVRVGTLSRMLASRLAG